MDNDGLIDAVVTALNGPTEVWRNVSPTPNRWLIVSTIGTRGSRDGMGAKLKLVSASETQYNHVNTAVGYGSSSDRRVHFGLGTDSLVKEIEITWLSGTVQVLENLKTNQIITVHEPLH
jgi:hypothetical protein